MLDGAERASCPIPGRSRWYLGGEVGVLIQVAASATSRSAIPSHFEPLRVRPRAVGNTAMSMPISAAIASSVRRATPVRLLASLSRAAKGRLFVDRFGEPAICPLLEIEGGQTDHQRVSELQGGPGAPSLAPGSCATAPGRAGEDLEVGRAAHVEHRPPRLPDDVGTTQSSLIALSSGAFCSRVGLASSSAICALYSSLVFRPRSPWMAVWMK